MKNVGRDVGLVRRNLTPSDLPVAGSDADERERILAERLDRFHDQPAGHDRPIAVVRRAAEIVVAPRAGSLFGRTGVRQRWHDRRQCGSAHHLFEKSTTRSPHTSSFFLFPFTFFSDPKSPSTAQPADTRLWPAASGRVRGISRHNRAVARFAIDAACARSRRGQDTAAA